MAPADTPRATAATAGAGSSRPSADQLAAALPAIRAAPRDEGRVELIVRRPDTERREVVEAADFDLRLGLIGDNWHRRHNRHAADGAPDPDSQLTLMGARAAAAIAGGPDLWPWAGDQLFVDLDLSAANLPPGTRLALGGAVLEITALPHTGCAKFADRFGPAALRFVSGEEGRELRLRGVYARVVQPGRIARGDPVIVQRQGSADPARSRTADPAGGAGRPPR
jgi:hypothetical protein